MEVKNSSFLRPEESAEKNAEDEKIDGSDSLQHLELDIISKGINFDLKKFGRELSLTEAEISNVEFDNNIYGVYEQCYQLIVKWQQKTGTKANKEEMIKALRRIGRSDIITLLGFHNEESQQPYLPRESTIDEAVSNFLTKLFFGVRDEQKILYSNNMLPQPLWTDMILPLEELFVDLEMFAVNSKGEEERGKPIKLHQLFSAREDQEPVRILIEGGPGYGKTTLSLKLISDWSNGKEYITVKFDLVFMITLRALRETETYLDIIKQEIAQDVNDEQLLLCLTKYQKRILLILDGFDELNENAKLSLIPLLQRREFPEMCIILTCRQGFFNFQEKRLTMSGLMESKRQNVNNFKFWQSRIKIKGIAPENQHLFLAKTFGDEFYVCKEELDNLLSKVSTELLECPLFLILLAILIAEEKSVSITTKTSLYKTLLNFVIRRSLVREGLLEDDQSVDIFEDSTNIPGNILQSIFQFGKLCLHHLNQNKLTFSENEIIKYCGKDTSVVKLGILFKHVSFPRRNRVEYYEPIHKSFMEFISAFHLWTLTQNLNSNDANFDEALTSLIDNGVVPQTNSLLYPFLGGLLNEKSSLLLDVLARRKVFEINQKSALSYVVTEIEDLELLSHSLGPFIPALFSIERSQQVEINEEYYNSIKRKQIFKMGIQKGLISYLRWESCEPFETDVSFYVETLQFHFQKRIDKTVAELKKKNIKCKNLICYFGEDIEERTWDSVVDVISSISAKIIKFDYSKRILMPFKIFPLMRSDLINNRWKNLITDKFTVDNLRNDYGYEIISMLIDLIESERITQELKIRCFSYVSRFSSTNEETNLVQLLLDSVAKSKHLKTFLFSYYGESNRLFIDFGSVCLGQRKIWNRLKFNGEFVITKSTNTDQCFVDELQIDIRNIDSELEILRHCQAVKYLYCRNRTFLKLVENQCSDQLIPLEEITLLFHDKFESKTSTDAAKYLTNLQILTLDSLRDNSLPIEAIPFLLEIIQNIKLRNLEIVFSSWSSTINSFLCNLAERLANDKRIENLIVAMEVHLPAKEIQECFCAVEKLLMTKTIEKFCVLNPNDQQLQQIIAYFSTSKKFNISKQIVVTNNMFSKYLQFSFFHNKLLSQSVCLTI